ncbi:DUF4352 domain-containing protein [Lederbergia graminis]|uniref:DUF4352 domain-containing protein n=1 Tax=Lederbergia graminis TaxID=735518 RepID=A0ABW0LM38_9BACI
MASNGLVPCKACKKEIAKGVKKCPNCGKDQRNWFMRHKILSFIAAIIVLGIIGSALGGGDEDTNTATENQSTGSNEKTEPKVYAIGEPVPADKLEVTITKVDEKLKIGSQYFNKEAAEGGTFLAIEYTLKNISDEPVGMFDYPQVTLVDEKGTEYKPDIEASTMYAVDIDKDNSKVLSDLNPDISVTDSDVYEISKDRYAQGKWFLEIMMNEFKLNKVKRRCCYNNTDTFFFKKVIGSMFLPQLHISALHN